MSDTIDETGNASNGPQSPPTTAPPAMTDAPADADNGSAPPLTATGNNATPAPATPTDGLLDVAALLAEPEQAHLIEGICTAGSFGVLHAKANVGKTFFGIDFACSIASGRPWHGRAVKRGPVLYIAAEGKAGLKKRLRAWIATHGNPGQLLLWPEPLNLMQPTDVSALREKLRVRRFRPRLIVVDTWSACVAAGGGDENTAKDSGRAAGLLQGLARQFGATVLVLHHEGHGEKGRMRGSSGLPATADTIVALKRHRSGVLTLRNTKQRDIGRFPDLHFRLERVEGSCILEPTDAPPPDAPPLSEKATAALQVLPAVGDGLTYTIWRKASGQPDRTFRRSRDELMAAGVVKRAGEGKGAKYRQVIDTGQTGGLPAPPVMPATEPTTGNTGAPRRGAGVPVTAAADADGERMVG